MPYLCIKNLSKHYKQRLILDSISLQLDKGKTIGILGENGAGKSTLIKSTLKLVHPDFGQVSSSLPAQEIAYLPEHNYLPEAISALEIVKFSASFQKKSTYSPQKALAQVGLRQEAWNHPIRSYSKGMRQRTAIAMLLVRQPRCLILDEPMSGLDAVGRKHILDLLQNQQKRGCSILISSHHVTDLVRLCDEVIILANGKIQETIHILEQSLEEAEMLEQKLKTYSRGCE